ncbi:MAG TPA: DUF4124 domain-containing protein [Casimicrobiaceae bacterium]
MDVLPAARMRRVLVALMLLALAAPAAADIYKCAGGADGQPVYQDSACRPGRELRNFQTDPSTVSVVPFDVTPSVAPASEAKPARQKRAAKDPADASKRTRRTKPNIPAGNAAERKFLHPGMSEAEVVARIGAPDIRSGNANGRGGARWSYLPTEGDAGMITTLHLSSGQVTQIDRMPAR